MDIILACSLIVASFLCCLFSMIAPNKLVRIGFLILWIVPLEVPRWIDSLPDWWHAFLIAAMVPAAVIASFVTRRRVIPPCIPLNDPYRGYRLVFLLALFIFSGYILIRLSRGVPEGLAITITLFLVFALFFSLSLRSQICGNGIWLWGELHTWDQYESYVWTTRDDGALVELKQRERFREPFASRLVRLTVPLESSEAAKQLLEANLTNSEVKRAGA